MTLLWISVAILAYMVGRYHGEEQVREEIDVLKEEYDRLF